jgi:hypothetical protein
MSAFRNPLDADEQLALFGENPGDYTDSQINWLQDLGSTPQEINFDNLPFVNNLVSWNDAYITVPIEIVGTGFSSANINTTAIALAAGTESIFTQVRFELSSGSSIINEINNQTAIINPIRKQIEWSDDKLSTYGSENMYAPTHLDSGGYNVGFNKSVQFFVNQILIRSATNISVLLKVYLRDLHDIFKNLTWPMINFRWGLHLLVAWPFNTASTFHSLLQTTAATTTITSATITNDINNPTIFVSGACRLYQRHIKLNPLAELKLSSMLETGFTKRVHFLDTEVAPIYTSISPTETTFGFQVATNSTNVKRVIIFAVPTGTFTTSSSFSAASAGNYPWCTAPASRLSAASLLVNNQPLYTRVLSLDNEFYMELRNQFVDSGLSMKSGSLITYDNWKLGTQLYYVFDLTRIRNRTSTEQPVNLYFNGTRAAATSQTLDWYAVMEKDSIVDWSCSRSSAQIVRIL